MYLEKLLKYARVSIFIFFVISNICFIKILNILMLKNNGEVNSYKLLNEKKNVGASISKDIVPPL